MVSVVNCSSDDEDDIVDHVAVRAVVEEFGQWIAGLEIQINGPLAVGGVYVSPQSSPVVYKLLSASLYYGAGHERRRQICQVGTVVGSRLHEVRVSPGEKRMRLPS